MTSGPCPETNLVRCAGAGVVRKLVHRDVEHFRFVLEDVLRAVAVVDVDIDDGDATGAEAAGMRGGYRHVVVETEAHGAVVLGVVPRGT